VRRRAGSVVGECAQDAVDDVDADVEGGSVCGDGPNGAAGSTVGSRMRGSFVGGLPTRSVLGGASKGEVGTPRGSVIGRSEAGPASLARRLLSVAGSQAGGALPILLYFSGCTFKARSRPNVCIPLPTMGFLPHDSFSPFFVSPHPPSASMCLRIC
jgi:hypothetical protein